MEHLNGGPPIQIGQGSTGGRGMVSPSSGSSFSILSNHTGSQLNNGYSNAMQPVLSNIQQDVLTDVSLEQAMEKVQELARENSTLREFLKENNENMKQQFQMLLQWKEKVRDSNKSNLIRFEQLHREINILKMENEKYKQCIASPDKQNSVLEELQKNIRKLEREKLQYEQQIKDYQNKVADLSQRVKDRSPDCEMVYVSSPSDQNELESYKKRCAELTSQVHNFHQQNEQLLLDLQQVNTLKSKIQAENNLLNEQNLALQKRVQGLFGDINKTKYSVGALRSSDTESMELRESENKNVSKSDMELLELQTAAAERQNSVEEFVSGVADELKEKLHLEKERSSKQKQQLSSKEVEIHRLQSQLSEKDQMLGHYKEQLDSQIAHITQEHKRQQQDLIQQLDMLNSELQRTKSSMPYQGDVQNLKSQVMTLIKESQELSAKLEMSTKQLDKKSARVVELEQHLCRREEEFTQTRREADSLVQQLRYSLSTAEDNIMRERQELTFTKKQLIEIRSSFSQLVNDYKELLDTFDNYKLQNQQSQSGNPNKQLLDEINRLTAQTIAAEEAIAYRDDQIKELKQENIRLKDEIDNTIPVLKAQAELWKQDFDAERYARERQVAEKENILQEMKNLELKNQQLLDEIENYSRQSLAEMQRRHAAPLYQQQLQNQFRGNQHYPSNQYPSQPGSAGAGNQGQPLSPRQYGNQGGGYQSPQPVEHGGDDNLPRQQDVHQAQSPQPPSHGSNETPDEGDTNLACPKCTLICPDLDSLQIHVLDCLDY